MSLLPEVRNELVATAERRAAVSRRPRRWRWLPRWSAGAVTVALSTGCTVAVALVALLSLGGHHAPVKSPGAAPSSVASLKAKLGVLRRSQTAADRTYRMVGSARSVKGPAELIVSLTRLATTVQTPTVGRVDVFVIVRRLPSGSAPPTRHSAFGAGVVTVAQRDQGTGAGLPAAGLSAPGTIASGLQIAHAGVNPNIGATAQLLPDGVTRVKWVFSGAGLGITRPHPVTVYASVHNNVAAAAIRSDQGPLQRSTWYGADGTVIASAPAGEVAQQQRARIRAINASRTRPVAPVLLTHFGLFRSVAPDGPARDWKLPTYGSQGGYAGGMGLNYWQTRYIPSATGIDGRGLWITPGTRGLCITDPEAGECGKLPSLKGPGVIGGISGGSHQQSLSGLAPDGNKTVTLILANGERKTIPVINNVYEATVAGRIVAIIDRNMAGRVERHKL